MRTAFVRVRVGHVGFDRGSGNFRFLRIGQGFSTVALREWDGGVQGFRVGIKRMSDVQRWLRGDRERTLVHRGLHHLLHSRKKMGSSHVW